MESRNNFFRQGGHTLIGDNNTMLGITNSPRDHALGQMLVIHMEETITGQQVERVLAPALLAARQGGARRQTNRPRKGRVLQYPYLLAATAMVAVVVVSVLSNVMSMRQVGIGDTYVEIIKHFELPPEGVSLAGPELFEKIAPGYMDLIGGDVRNIRLAVVDAQNRSLLGETTKGDDGVFRFDPLPDGNHRAVALLPARYDAPFSGIEIGSIVVADGSASKILNRGLENFWEGVDIQICLMGSG